MCHIDQFCYKCGHEVESKVQKCSIYRQKKAAAKGSIFRFLFRNRRSCGKVNYYRVSRAVACSQECAKRLRARAKREQRQRDEKEEVLVQRARDKAAAQRKYMENKRKKDEVELAQRERARVKRAEAARREYLENKRKEEEALRRRQEERRRAEMLLARQQTRGTSEPSTSRDRGAHASRRVHRQTVSEPPYTSRAAPSRAPPRLAERALHPQAYRGPGPANPQPPQSSRSQANTRPQGGSSQDRQTQQRAARGVVVSPPAHFDSRSQARPAPRQGNKPQSDAHSRPRQEQSRRQAPTVPATQPVTARRPVMVSQTTSRVQPNHGVINSHAAAAPASRTRTPAPPGPNRTPMSPPKHTRPYENPELVPAPLFSSRSKTAETAARRLPVPAKTSSSPSGLDPAAVPRRKPVPTTTTKPATPPTSKRGERARAPAPERTVRRPNTAPRPSATTPTPSSSGYRPNPMLANRNGNAAHDKAKAPPRTEKAHRAAATAAAGWLKDHLAPPHRTDSPEWVSKDAAEIERGGRPAGHFDVPEVK